MPLFLHPRTQPSNPADFEVENGELKKYKGNGGDVVIPDGVTSIGNYAFGNCVGLTSVTIPDGVTSIGFMAFAYCASLTNVTIPDSVTSIDAYAFNSCTSLTSVTIPNSVTSIGGRAFDMCTRLTSITIPYGVTSIGNHAFCNCVGLTSVTIPNSVTSIEDRAFSGCKGLTSVTIPNSVTSIGNAAFFSCYSLTDITIPDSVTSIESSAFSNCTGLKDVYYGGTEAQWKMIDIGSLNDSLKNAKIHYNGSTPTQPTGPQAAMPTNDRLTADGSVKNPTVYKINDSNYFKIRDLALILNGSGKQFSVGYDGSLNAVTATTGQPYAATGTELAGAPTGNSTAEPSNDAIYVNGARIQVEVYKIDGSNYFKLRDLGKALNFYVGWTAERGMFIETGASYSE